MRCQAPEQGDVSGAERDVHSVVGAQVGHLKPLVLLVPVMIQDAAFPHARHDAGAAVARVRVRQRHPGCQVLQRLDEPVPVVLSTTISLTS